MQAASVVEAEDREPVTDNPYAAPSADAVDDERGAPIDGEYSDYYVVAPQKFYLLSLFTVGMYTLYWFFAQFRAQKRAGMKTNPVFAALFNVFTAYRLFKRLDRTARREGLSNVPRAVNQAAPYIVLTLIGQSLRVVSEHDRVLSGIAFLAFALTALPLGRVQTLVNRLAGDPEGRSNARLSPLNVLAIAVGGIVWVLAFIGLALAPTR